MTCSSRFRLFLFSFVFLDCSALLVLLIFEFLSFRFHANSLFFTPMQSFNAHVHCYPLMHAIPSPSSSIPTSSASPTNAPKVASGAPRWWRLLLLLPRPPSNLLSGPGLIQTATTAVPKIPPASSSMGMRRWRK